MSADNGIYILKTTDQYRVAHLQAIDNVTWSAIDGDWRNIEEKKGLLVPTRVVEMWGHSRYTRKESVACNIAHKWCNSLLFCEYGITTIPYNKMWWEIILDASDYAKKEIEYIKKSGKEDWYDMNMLQKIADKKIGI